MTCLESVSVSAGQADRSERLYAVHNVARICDQSRTYDVVSLPSNGIGAEGAQGLVPLLELGTSLRTLNLRFCDIDAAGCAALSEGVGGVPRSLNCIYLATTLATLARRRWALRWVPARP